LTRWSSPAASGKNSAVVRSLVLSRLGFLGLAEDAHANAAHGRETARRISLDGPVLALVVPTDEELLIARDTARVIAGDQRSIVHETV
jgi:acetate kinase